MRTGTIVLGSVLILGASLAAVSAEAADQLTVGKAFPTSFTFVPVNVGVETGIMAKHGLDVKILGFMGAAKLHQGITAGDVDIGLAAGTDMAFVAKGAPEKAVAEMASAPMAYGILSSKDSGITTIAGLKGKKIAVASPNSLIFWLLTHFSAQEGWGLDGIQPVYISGTTAASIAAMRTHQVDGMTTGIDVGRDLEKKGEGKLLVDFGDYVKLFITHAIFASDTLMTDRPDVLRRFLVAWFETIDFMNANKDETLKIYMGADGVKDPDIARASADIILPSLTRNGRFDRAALGVVAHAIVDLQLLDHVPDMTPLYTEAYLPGAP